MRDNPLITNGVLHKESVRFNKICLFLFFFMTNTLYIGFLILKHLTSYRGGVQSISQDVADHLYLQIILLILIILYFATNSFLQYALYIKQIGLSIRHHVSKLQHIDVNGKPPYITGRKNARTKARNYKEFAMNRIYFLKQYMVILYIIATIRTIFLSLILIFPIDKYPTSHKFIAGTASAFIWIFEIGKFIQRCHYIRLVDDWTLSKHEEHWKAEEENGIERDILIRVLIANSIFVFLLIPITFWVYAGHLLSHSDIESTSAIAVFEHLFFASIGLGIIFQFTELHF